jgi:2-dehydropantoate 2-reductase
VTERVCVVGAGAIGSLLAAHLARVADTWVLTRRDEHARELGEHGLTVSGKARFTSRPGATAEARELPELDVVFIATKTTGLDVAAASLDGIARGATVVTVQNGLGAEEIIQRHGGWSIVSGTTLMGGTRRSETHVEYELDAPTWLGPYAETATPLARAEEIGALIVESGLKAEVFPDLRPAKWSKLIFNAVVATVSALTSIPHSGAMVATDELGDLGHLVRDAIEEGKAIASAAGIELHEDPWQLNVEPIMRGTAAGRPYVHRPSMMLDVDAGRHTEFESNVGELLRAADRLGVDAPLIATLYRLMRGKERSAADAG